MSARVTCGNCGGRIDLPAGYSKAKIRCPGCGYYAEVPPAARSSAPPAEGPRPTRPIAKPVAAKPAVRAKRSIDPRDHRPKFEADAPHGPPLLAGTDEFEDEKPYAVPGTGTKPCPHCRGELPLDARLCVHCGRDLAGGKATPREFQPLRRTWSEGWPLDRRAALFAGAVAIDVVVIGLLAISSGEYGVCLFLLLVQASLQAFILGTFDTVELRRTVRGQTTLNRLRRIGFLPMPPEKLPWKGSHMVGVVATHDPGIFSYLVCAYLFSLGILPGVVFFWIYIRPERFEVVACDVYGGTDAVLLRANGQDEADDAVAVIADATGLVVRKIM